MCVLICVVAEQPGAIWLSASAGAGAGTCVQGDQPRPQGLHSVQPASVPQEVRASCIAARHIVARLTQVVGLSTV